MNMDAIGMLIITTVAAIVQACFWRWVSAVSDASRGNAEQIAVARSEMARFRLDVATHYQNKADAHRDTAQIMKAIDDLRADIKHLSSKLDRKMDK